MKYEISNKTEPRCRPLEKGQNAFKYSSPWPQKLYPSRLFRCYPLYLAPMWGSLNFNISTSLD